LGDSNPVEFEFGREVLSNRHHHQQTDDDVISGKSMLTESGRDIWKQTKRKKTVEASGRYEFHGTGKDLYKAVVKANRIVPKSFVTVSAEKFLERPEDYGLTGKSNPRPVQGYTDREGHAWFRNTED
jgi:hypothetical protein